MPCYLGMDTSNYTTSAAIYDSTANTVIQSKKLLPVKENELGLRQSDAVFHHTKQLPEMLTAIFASPADIQAVGVSVRPRNLEGSYMPCFLCGEGLAESISAVNRIPCYKTSHQIGHILAALFSAEKFDWIHKPFLAFHVSGGTTDCLLVTPEPDEILYAELAATSLDLKAGQAVDRVGVMLGLRFPCGAALEKLAEQSNREFNVKPTMKGMDCCLSGVENQCRKMLESGEAHSDIARYCLHSIGSALVGMTSKALEEFGKMPLLYAGGVMSNVYIRQMLEKRFDASFAEPAFSCDNAAGTAIFAALKAERGS